MEILDYQSSIHSVYEHRDLKTRIQVPKNLAPCISKAYNELKRRVCLLEILGLFRCLSLCRGFTL